MKYQAVIVAAVLVLFPGQSRAGSVLYGTDLVTDQLISIDPNTGQGTSVGSYVVPTANHLTFDSLGNLYGYDGSVHRLVTLDTTTGEASVVAPLSTNAVGLRSLAFDPDDDLFAVNGSNELVRIDPLTAEATTIGDVVGHIVKGMAFTDDGVLYAVTSARRLITINTVTGSTTELADLFASTVDLSFDGLTIDNDGIFYSANDLEDTLLIINPTTGEATTVGPFGFSGVNGLASPPSMTVVPLPAAAWTGLALMGGIGGVRVLKRRRHHKGS